MSTIKFSNGKTVNFNGTPTQQDIQEVAQKLGIDSSGGVAPAPKKTESDYSQAFDAAGNAIGNTEKGIFNFFTNGIQALTKNVALSATSPEHVQAYSDAVTQHNDITTNVLKAIQQKKSLGQNTSKLQDVLNEQMSSTPQLQDFLDPDTLKRVQDTIAGNIEELAGQFAEAGLNIAALNPAGGLVAKGADVASEGGKSLGGKIIKGAVAGAGFGAASGAASGVSKEEGASDIASSAGEGAAEGAAIGAGGELVGGVASNILKDRLAFGTFAKVPKSAEGALQSVEDAKQTVLDAQKITKANLDNPDLPTASEVQGDQKHTQILTQANKLLTDEGNKMGDILKNPVVGGAPTDISEVTSNFDSELAKRVSVSTNNDKIILRDFQNDLSKITGGPVSTDYGGRVGNIQTNGSGQASTLNEVDQFLRKWQKVDASSKMQNNEVGALIDSTVHNINEKAKSTADSAETAAGIKGHPYRSSNDEYKKLVTNINAAQSEVTGNPKGKTSEGKNTITDRYENSDSVYRKNGTKDSSKSWKALAQKTGIPLGQPAILTKVVEDIYHGTLNNDFIDNMNIGFSIPRTAARVILSALKKSSKDPDAVVQKMLQFIEDSKSKTK